MEERLIDKFLKEYIQDLISCSDDNYDMSEADINDVVYAIEDNEHLWSIIDNTVYDEIEKFRKEEGDEEDE